MKKWSYLQLVGVLRIGDLMTPRLAFARCPRGGAGNGPAKPDVQLNKGK